MTTYVVDVVPESNAHEYDYYQSADHSHKLGSLNVPQAFDETPEVPENLSNDYYFSPDHNPNWTQGTIDPASVYSINGSNYYGSLIRHRVYLDSVAQGVPFDIFEFTMNDRGKTIVLGTSTAHGSISNQIITKAYQNWRSTNTYYENAKPLNTANVPDVYDAPVQDYSYDGVTYRGPVKSYQIPVKMADDSNVNGNQGQPNVPVNGDRMVGTLPIPIYKSNDFSNYVGNLNLSFGSPLVNNGQTATPSQTSSIYVGDDYCLPLNSDWMQNYIHTNFFNGNGYHEAGQSLSSNVHPSDFGNEKNPNQLHIQFKNVATVVSDGSDHAASARDNHLDMWMGFSSDPSKMRDVATIKGHVAYEPQNNSKSDDLRDYVITSIDWHDQAKNINSGDGDNQAKAQNSNDANVVKVGNDSASAGDPVSLHYTFDQNESARVFYTNVDGDLLDVNPADQTNPQVVDNVDGQKVEGTFGSVVVWRSGPHQGEAVSGKDTENYQSDLEGYAQKVSNQSAEEKDGVDPVPSPLDNGQFGIKSNLSINYAPQAFRDYQFDGQGNAIFFTNHIRSTTNVNPDNHQSFTANDAKNKLFGISDFPVNDNQKPIRFLMPEYDSQPDTQIKNGDSALITPFVDQINQKQRIGAGHWFAPDPQSIKRGYIPLSDTESEHGTFNHDGMFIPDDYESSDEPSNLKWAPSSVKITFVKVHGNHTTSDEDANQTFYPTIASDDYVGKDHIFNNNDYAKYAPSDLLNDGYHLDASANGAQKIGDNGTVEQYFVLPNGTAHAYIYVSKAGSGNSVNPNSSDSGELINPFNPNPNYNSGQPIGPSNEPFIPVTPEGPDTPNNPNANHHHNLIPSPNHQYFDRNDPADHDGMIPAGSKGWLPSNEIPAVQADFTIQTEIKGNDGGADFPNLNVPVAVDLTGNQLTNHTYTLSTKNIREAIVNYLLNHGYVDRAGQSGDLRYDSIMRIPNSVYRPIKYQIQLQNGNYHVVLADDQNSNAGQFMYTPSNVIINYEGAIYERNANNQMIAMDIKTHQPIDPNNPNDRDPYNRLDHNGDDETGIESIVAEGYQGMVIDPAQDHILQNFLSADGWTMNQVTKEEMKPITLDGYDYHYLEHNHENDHKFKPGNGGDFGSEIVQRLQKFHSFYKDTDFDHDLEEASDLPDERLEANQVNAPVDNHITINGIQFDYGVTGPNEVSYRGANGHDVKVGTYQSADNGTLTYPNGSKLTTTPAGQHPSNQNAQPLMTDPNNGQLMIDPAFAGKPTAGLPRSPRVSLSRRPALVRSAVVQEPNDFLKYAANLVNRNVNAANARLGIGDSGELQKLTKQIRHLSLNNHQK